MGPSMGHAGHPGQHQSHGGPPQNAPTGPNSLSTSNQSNKSTVVVSDQYARAKFTEITLPTFHIEAVKLHTQIHIGWSHKGRISGKV